jgi:hypothetical protein
MDKEEDLNLALPKLAISIPPTTNVLPAGLASKGESLITAAKGLFSPTALPQSEAEKLMAEDGAASAASGNVTPSDSPLIERKSDGGQSIKKLQERKTYPIYPWQGAANEEELKEQIMNLSMVCSYRMKPETG